MAPEGMVHALREAHRVIRPEGVIADLRPGLGSGELDVDQGGRWVRLGPTASWIEDEGKGTANLAVARAQTEGWLRLRSRETFAVHYYFQHLTELEAYAAERWSDAVLHQGTLGRARSMGGGPIRLERPLDLQVLDRVG